MKYSAGMVTHLFWLNEMRNTVPYYREEKPLAEIRSIAVEKNLYQVRAEDRTKRIAGIIFRRLAVLSPELREELITADSAASKIIVLVSIMKTDLLFAEFMQQVFRKAVQLGEKELYRCRAQSTA